MRVIDYGNWASKRLIYIPAIVAAYFLGLAFVSPYFLIAAFIFIVLLIYFSFAYYKFSAKGGNIQSQVIDMVVNRIDWTGNGRVLDVGCGNGALAIKIAKKFPSSHVIGIDYWGAQWDYARDACIRNAEVEGVYGRMEFKKASASSLPFEDESFDLAVSNFVFHEVHDAKDKRAVIREALRVVKKGGCFVFHDLFKEKAYFGSMDTLLFAIRSWGIQQVEFIDTSGANFVPGPLRLPFMLGSIGIIRGIK